MSLSGSPPTSVATLRGTPQSSAPTTRVTPNASVPKRDYGATLSMRAPATSCIEPYSLVHSSKAHARLAATASVRSRRTTTTTRGRSMCAGYAEVTINGCTGPRGAVRPRS